MFYNRLSFLKYVATTDTVSDLIQICQFGKNCFTCFAKQVINYMYRLCADVFIVAALLTSCIAAEWKPKKTYKADHVDSWTEVLDQLSSCYRQPGSLATTNKQGLAS